MRVAFRSKSFTWVIRYQWSIDSLHQDRKPFEIISSLFFFECGCFRLFTRTIRFVQKLHDVRINSLVFQSKMLFQWNPCFKLLCTQLAGNWKRHNSFFCARSTQLSSLGNGRGSLWKCVACRKSAFKGDKISHFYEDNKQFSSCRRNNGLDHDQRRVNS